MSSDGYQMRVLAHPSTCARCSVFFRTTWPSTWGPRTRWSMRMARASWSTSHSIIAVNTLTNEVEAVAHRGQGDAGPHSGQHRRHQADEGRRNRRLPPTEKMLNYFIMKAHNNRRRMVHPRIVIGVPSEITPGGEARGDATRTYRAKGERGPPGGTGDGGGHRRWAAHHRAGRHMVIDIGGGTTDIAVISLSGIVYSKSVRMAGNQMDEAVITYLKAQVQPADRRAHRGAGQDTAGSAFPLDKPLTMRDQGAQPEVEGVPKTITIEDSEIREALSECVSTIINAIRVALERTPPELSADISDRRHRADRRRRADQEPGQAHPRREPACQCRSPTTRWRRWWWVRARCCRTSSCCAKSSIDSIAALRELESGPFSEVLRAGRLLRGFRLRQNDDAMVS